MASSLSNIVNSLSERIYKTKCIYEQKSKTMIKNVKLAESNICVGIVFLHEQL